MAKQSKTKKQEYVGKGKAPKSLLSLAAILDEYITLKEQKVLVDQEIEHEKLRVQNLLNGMQEAMNAYNTPPPPPSAGTISP
ncbi:hypothetical protein SASPL_108727 [Salvia splendens]|uniref:Uncharacterized protein n=1 Tax=Salvia splendens TaxID=180675 RepID=A0A8X8YIN0_SALSN|nr:hypothetical protein SASPL_108727 [Salvia splendens]